ncbi:MAG: 2,3-bisphosphoglycerate-independent phosphoglycerate mutase [Ruminococcus sp.]|nr:2,3-bisphosphoglycerate-independent phosphoglycerate mutase [Ruminococcus sp.]
MKKPLILMILDGYGIAPAEGNAICAANKPNLDKIFSSNPITEIGASGMNVGLPDGQMGNSEVGHTNIGAGRIVYQELTRITKTINEDKLKDNEAIVNAIDKAVENGTALHLMGLLSDGGVHSHITHLYGILELAKKKGLEKVYIHAFLDGRDVPPSSAADFVKACADKTEEIGVGKIATVMGRYYAMDRDNRWDRVEKAYAAMVYGEGAQAECAVCAVKNSYNNDVTDEFVVPTVVNGGATIQANDSVIFFNFRPDRAREITRTFVDPEFDGFERKNGFFPINFVCMTQYDATMPNVDVAFKPQTLVNTLGEYISSKGMTQLRIAETEKYAHVTFFFNGGVEKQYEGEDRILVKSPAVATYDLQPEMSAYEVTDKLVPAIKEGKYDMIILNFANCDMVGHTGDFNAAVKAVEAVDACVGKVIDAIDEMGGVALITADHGNADKMVDDDGKPFTAHTTNLVPFCVTGYDCKLREGGTLADIAPTMLQILGLEQPADMDGKSLIV